MLSRLSLHVRRLSVNLPRYTDAESPAPQPSEDKIKTILQSKFPQAEAIEVQDISGGCGAMFEIFVSTTEFKDLSTVRQHLLINKILKDEIKNMHGIRIHTAIPGKS